MVGDLNEAIVSDLNTAMVSDLIYCSLKWDHKIKSKPHNFIEIGQEIILLTFTHYS